MKTIEVIRCKRCGAHYYAGKENLILKAQTHLEPPDDIDFLILSISKCQECKKDSDRKMA